jgi:hypothetical protein
MKQLASLGLLYKAIHCFTSGLTPELIPSQKYHINIDPVLNGCGAMDV